MKITFDFESDETFHGSKGETLCNLIADACRDSKPVTFFGAEAMVIRYAVSHQHFELRSVSGEVSSQRGSIGSVEFELLIIEKPGD